MIYVVLTETQEEFVKAYFLASCLNRDANCLIPVSNPIVCDLVEQTLVFLKIPYRKISFSVLLQMSLPLLLKEQTLYLNRINSSALLIDIAYFQQQIIYKSNQGVAHIKDKRTAFIVSWAESTSNQAVQYSLLMNRPLILLQKTADNCEFFSAFNYASSYFISFSDDLSMSDFIEFLNYKDQNNNKVPFAIMYPYGEVEREFFVIKTFLFARYPYPYEYKASFHFPLERPNYCYKGKNVSLYLGQDTDTVSLVERLIEPSSLLFAMAHSNGIDMGLGNIVLCPRETTPVLSAVGIKAMPCFFNLELCSRVKPDNIIIKLNQLKAQIAFFYTCWGIQLKNGLYDPSVSFARQLVLSPHIGMIVSTYTMSHLDNSILSKFMHHVKNDSTISDVVNQLNSEHFKFYSDIPHTLIVLGDPEFKLNQSFPSDFDQLFPDEVKSHLIKKGIIKYKKCNKCNKTEPDIGLISAISIIVNDVLYAKTVVLGSRSLPLGSIKVLLDEFMLFLDGLWILILLIKKRLSQSAQHYVNPNNLLIELQKEVVKYHKYWIDYFVIMNSNFGGLIRLQIDKFFDEKNKIEPCKHNCPYCAGVLIENELSLIEHEQLNRRVLECYSCTTIFDSHAVFTFGSIDCDIFWIKTIHQTMTVHLLMSPVMMGEFNYTVCVCLEPFYKKGQSNISSHIENGQINMVSSDERLIDITINNFIPLDYYTSGQYYLNIMIIVNTSVAFLRRTIHIKDL